VTKPVLSLVEGEPQHEPSRQRGWVVRVDGYSHSSCRRFVRLGLYFVEWRPRRILAYRFQCDKFASEVDTDDVPLVLGYFCPGGLFAPMRSTFVGQEMEQTEATDGKGRLQDFALLDVAQRVPIPACAAPPEAAAGWRSHPRGKRCPPAGYSFGRLPVALPGAAAPVAGPGWPDPPSTLARADLRPVVGDRLRRRRHPQFFPTDPR
jgi:hypothetical protein